ncbi:hypothetical protein CW751_07295 [Brumimicrobium salinarum]|uniref:Uncharacterized protein n=2 Tax=Brumimicrobium salinarum TaxID=2058658 RepID=A0A2I0R310_9FLAO|nr:hypothetical protein CW751_07295 [Brumimicrobium salinarum]
MKKTLHTFLLICLSCNLLGQGGNCDSTYTFAFIKDDKVGPMIMNGYTVIVKTNTGENIEFSPTPITYLDNDSLVIDNDLGYIKTKDLLCDSSTVMTYKYKDFEVSFKCAPLCQWGFMDFGVYIYHFSNYGQLKRFKKAKRAIVHPINTWELKKEDFPLTLVALDTEEFTLELEIIK